MVRVLYAGSLVEFMQNDVTPDVARATHLSVRGFPAGSRELASEIKTGTQEADVFISAAPAVNSMLEGSVNGNWVSWDAIFATSPLVLGYSASSRFARGLRTEPWYDVVTRPGFLLGRTDPAVDPKGVLAVSALEKAASRHHEPMLADLATSTRDVFPEETLVGRLQAGQLDAGFFYRVEAASARLETVPLQGVAAHATYTITVLNRAPDRGAAIAFVHFLLGPKGRALMRAGGLDPGRPRFEVTGHTKKVPSAVTQVVDR